MVTNQNLKLKIKYMRTLFYLTISTFIIFSSYNYILKPVDIEIKLVKENFDNFYEFILIVIPKNELNFKTPIVFNEIETQIVEGNNLVEIIPINSTTFRIKPIDHEREGMISIQLSMPRLKIKKLFEFHISSQKV